MCLFRNPINNQTKYWSNFGSKLVRVSHSYAISRSEQEFDEQESCFKWRSIPRKGETPNCYVKTVIFRAVNANFENFAIMEQRKEEKKHCSIFRAFPHSRHFNRGKYVPIGKHSFIQKEHNFSIQKIPRRKSSITAIPLCWKVVRMCICVRVHECSCVCERVCAVTMIWWKYQHGMSDENKRGNRNFFKSPCYCDVRWCME